MPLDDGNQPSRLTHCMDIRWHPRDFGWCLRMDSIFHGTGAASGVAARRPLGR